MKWIPHQYQVDSVKFLLGQKRAGLFLDMGLGKTVISLYSAKQLLEAGHIGHILLIAPIRALYTVWPNEIAKWDDFQDISYYNWHEGRCAIKDLPDVDIVGINPESALTLMKNKEFATLPFDLLIIDESAAYKNYASQRFKFLKKVLHCFDYRWILTGTPAPNGLEDLWSQIYILDEGKALGKYITHFRTAYCIPDRSGYGYTVMDNYRQTIYEAIAGLTMRLSARDNIDMPELVVNTIPVKLDAKAMSLYKDMERKLIILLESGETVLSPNAAVAGMRCRQIANGGIYLEDHSISHIHTAKMEALKEVVEDLQGQPLIVFYEFLHDLPRITAALGELPNLTTSKTPSKLVQEFNEGKHPVLLGHPATVGVGLNLQGACSNVLWVGIPWDLYLYDQANARVYRQGQDAERVVVHHLVAQGTLDEKVVKALAVKGREQTDLLEAIQTIRQRNN
jgi:SNF2 family DNA or RNA helicase